MKPKSYRKLKTTLLLPAALLITPAGLLANDNIDYSNGPATRFIIKYKHATELELAEVLPGAQGQQRRAQAMQRKAERLSSHAGERVHYVRETALQRRAVFGAERRLSARETERMLALLAQDDAIEYVEEDVMLQATFTPNDPQYGEQWHYFESTGGIRAPQAWDSATGQNVVVAVLDTGYRPHADLAANLLPGYDMISDAFVGNDGDGRDSDARDPGDWTNVGECGNGQPTSFQPSSWHGTHVAGTIAAVTNNNQGVAGVAYNAKVVPVRVLGKCGGYTSDIADGIIWASGGTVAGVPANANPAHVINMSLGGQGSCSSTTQNAINIARNNGSVIVVAAGNSNANANNFNPGNCNGVINVAATNRSGGRAYYSNYGTSVDVAAPGGAMNSSNDPNGVLSTYNTGSTTPQNDSYAFSQGTSMAAPHVAGVAALIKQVKPAASPDEVANILKSTSRSFPSACSGCGTGIIDANAAVQAAIGSGAGNGANELQKGVVVSNLSGATGSSQYFSITVPAGAADLSFTMSGGTGDADLYVRFGSEPTLSTYDCRPYRSGNNESCNFASPQAGVYHVMIHGYSGYSGVSLVADYTAPAGGSGSNSSLDDLAATTGNWLHYTVTVPAGMGNLTATISGGTGDADLYVRRGARPTLSAYDCRPYRTGNNETCNFTDPAADTWHISIYAYSSFSGVRLEVEYKP